jgi:hypothetical protein
MIDARGGCHCKAVRFAVRLPDPPVPALDCNCSICTMTGFVHLIVPHGDFTLESGTNELTGYRFGTGAAEHLFCATCGVKSFYQPRSHPDAWSVNALCLDDRPELDLTFFDGRDFEKAKAALDGH